MLFSALGQAARNKSFKHQGRYDATPTPANKKLACRPILTIDQKLKMPEQALAEKKENKRVKWWCSHVIIGLFWAASTRRS